MNIKTVVTLTIIILLGLCGMVAIKSKEPTQPVVQTPLTATAVVQCSMIILVTVTYPDGRFVVIDAKNHQGYDNIKDLEALVLSAKNKVVAEAQCANPGLST